MTFAAFFYKFSLFVMKKFIIGAAAAATMLLFAMPAMAVNNSLPGCNKAGTTFVGQVDNSSSLVKWDLNIHGSYTLGKCGGTAGPSEGDWNVQTLTATENGVFYSEFYKNVFSSKDLTPNGAFPYWDIESDPTYSGSGYHQYTPGHFTWWIVKSEGNSPYLEPVNNVGIYIPTNATHAGFGVFK